MISSKMALRATLAATAALAVFPAAGVAADDTTPTSTTIGSELSVEAPASTTLTSLTHASPATGSAQVKVTSTTPHWSLTATDEAVAHPGHMDDGVDTQLTNPLEVNGDDLTGDGVSFSDGSFVGSKTFNFSQSLADADDVFAGQTFSLTVTYTALDTDA